VVRRLDGTEDLELARSEALVWPPATPPDVEALVEAVDKLAVATRTAGWEDFPIGPTWYAKRFRWLPRVVLEPGPGFDEESRAMRGEPDRAGGGRGRRAPAEPLEGTLHEREARVDPRPRRTSGEPLRGTVDDSGKGTALVRRPAPAWGTWPHPSWSRVVRDAWFRPYIRGGPLRPSGSRRVREAWPVETVQLWRCEIRWNPGYVRSRFEVVVYEPGKSEGDAVAESIEFKWLLKTNPDFYVAEHRAEVRSLAMKLEAGGWERIGRAPEWYAARFVWRREDRPPDIDAAGGAGDDRVPEAEQPGDDVAGDRAHRSTPGRPPQAD
jgi:hypothetical protein